MDVFDRPFSFETMMANERLDKHKHNHEIYVAAHLDRYKKDPGLHLTFFVTNIDSSDKEYPLVIVFGNGYFYAYSVCKVFRWNITNKMIFIRFLDENEGLTLIEHMRALERQYKSLPITSYGKVDTNLPPTTAENVRKAVFSIKDKVWKLIEPYRDKLEDLACLNGVVEGFDEDTD